MQIDLFLFFNIALYITPQVQRTSWLPTQHSSACNKGTLFQDNSEKIGLDTAACLYIFFRIDHAHNCRAKLRLRVEAMEWIFNWTVKISAGLRVCWRAL